MLLFDKTEFKKRTIGYESNDWFQNFFSYFLNISYANKSYIDLE